MKIMHKEAVDRRVLVAEREVLGKVCGIDSRFLVRLQYAFQSPDKVFLVMEYSSGGSLVEFSRQFPRRRLPKESSRRLAAQLASGLRDLHGHRIIHRDLKPENVLLHDDGFVKIADFGLSTLCPTTVQRGGPATRKAGFAGTVEYAAPERLQKAGAVTTAAVDWWAFGAILFEGLCGRTPFGAPTARDLFINVLFRDPAFLGDFDDDPFAKDLLEGLLLKDANARLTPWTDRAFDGFGSGPRGRIILFSPRLGTRTRTRNWPSVVDCVARGPPPRPFASVTMMTAGEPNSKKKAGQKPMKQLYDHLGNPKKEGDPPLGVGYDEDGCPVPDWDIEVDATHDNPDSNGRRRGAKIVGAVHLKDYVKYVKRLCPTWGKKFGYVKKDRVGFFGSFTVDEAKLCLCTEDFGWKLGDDAGLAPTPPYVRLCYGEHHGEQESIRLFTGLSEVHLLKDLDLREVHYMLQGLGYVSYNVPQWEEDRWWGEGIDVYPQKVSAGLAGGKGPMFYSWYYRLPPWMPGLALEGEDGDYNNGPLALKKKMQEEHKEMEYQKLNEDHMLDLKQKALEQREDWLSQAAAAAEADEKE